MKRHLNALIFFNLILKPFVLLCLQCCVSRATLKKSLPWKKVKRHLNAPIFFNLILKPFVLFLRWKKEILFI